MCAQPLRGHDARLRVRASVSVLTQSWRDYALRQPNCLTQTLHGQEAPPGGAPLSWPSKALRGQLAGSELVGSSEFAQTQKVRRC
jgi:hypothetical protein